ncbi:TonB-dependent receptor [candidate division KSB1 bacterium]|nr:TonB-dependent receptor [candidate division KSB1 bacterium]
MLHSIITTLITLFLLLTLTPIFSQNQDTIEYTADDTLVVTAERDQKFPQISSMATKIRIPLQATAAAISMVSNSINQNQGNSVLGEALNNVSGVNIQTGFGVHDYFVLRGFNTLDNGLMLTDGTIEPQVMIYNLYNIERVEILKGPGAFLYGGNPLSGTINLVRKQPTFNNFFHASGNYGSFKSYRATMDATFTNSAKNLSGRLNSVFQQSDYYRDDKANKVYALNPTFTWKINKNSEFNANVEYLKSEYKSDSGLPLVYNYQTGRLDKLAEVSRTTSFQTPADYSDQDMLRIKLNYTKKITRYLTLQNKFYYTNLGWKSIGTLLNGAYPTMDGSYWINRSLQTLDDRQRVIGNQTEFTIQLLTGKFEHTLLLGFEVSQYADTFKIEIVPQLPALNLNNPVETYQAGLYPAYPYQARNATNMVLAPYFMDIISLSPKILLFLGGRYDRSSFKVKNEGISKSYQNFSPMLGFSYSPLREVTFYANTGQAFAPPSSRAEGALEPEESAQIEFGMKNNLLNGKIRSTFVIYQLKKQNITIPDNNGFMRQVGDQRSRGLEFEVHAQMTAKCASIFAYSYTDAEMTDFAETVTIGMDQMGIPITSTMDRTGNKASFAPQHIVNFWHTRDIGSHFGFGAGVRYVSRQFIAEDNVYAIDGYTTVDATLYYKLNTMRWQLNLKNISNTKYEMRGFGGYAVIPAAPFAVFGGVEVTL